jgi:hypothetical protein
VCVWNFVSDLGEMRVSPLKAGWVDKRERERESFD